MVEKEIEPSATEGEITIFPGGGNNPDQGYTFTLQLGDLDPIDEMSGIDARLINLGFGPPDVEDSLSDDDRAEALKAFQDKFGLDVTGELTDATKSKLQDLHDGE
jgi:peptidoglycan hydrolase-like protein with peptidoglycan-binding domain